MLSDQTLRYTAPQKRRTRAIAAATVLPVMAGSVVGVSGTSMATPTSDSSHTVPAESTTTRSLTKQQRALKVKHANVFVVGDSLTVGCKNSIQSNLKRKTRSVRVDAQVGRFTQSGISILRSSAAKRSNVWIVALGTNDGPNPGTTKNNVRKVLKMAGKRKVIWLTVVRPGHYGRVNTALKQMDRKYSKLTVADWAHVVKKNKQLLSGDRVHLTARGYQVRGKFVASTAIRVAGK